MQAPKTKIFMLMVLPLILFPMIGIGAAHWYDNITKEYKLHMGRLDLKIISYKVLYPCGVLIQSGPPECQMPTKCISLSTKVFPGWYCWIGLKIQNFGSAPICVDGPTYTVTDPGGVWSKFIHTEYYYGQVIDGDSWGWPPPNVPQNVYALVKLNPNRPFQIAPPPPGNISKPVCLDAYGPHTKNTMILWIFLKFPKTTYNCNCNCFKLQICLKIPGYLCEIPPPSISSYTWEKEP